MEGLTLMVKGLIIGSRTLVWAVVLLFLMVYVVGVFLTIVVGNSAINNPEYEMARKSSFSTVPKSMFTTFRCLLIVDCSALQGTPLLPMMYDEYGVIFAMGYV